MFYGYLWGDIRPEKCDFAYKTGYEEVEASKFDA